MKRKNLFSLLSGLAIGIILIIIWLRLIPIAEIKVHYAGLKLSWVLLASLCYLLAYFLRSWRWNLLLHIPHKPGLWRTWLYAMGGNWLNYLIPLRIGDLARAWFIKKHHQVPLMTALPTVFIDKAFDTLAILFIIIILPFTALRVSRPMMILLGLLVIVFIVTLALLLLAAWYKEGITRILQRLFCWAPQRFKAKLQNGIRLFVSELNLFEHKPWRLILAMLLTAAGVALDGSYFFLLFRAFGIPYPFALALFGYTLINLSYALPQPPAQLGSNEWMMIIIFSIGFGLTKSAASAIMAFAHVLTAILMSAWGIPALAIMGKDLVTQLIKGDNIDDEGTTTSGD